MKKVFLSLAIAAIVTVTSCNQGAKTAESTVSTEETSSSDSSSASTETTEEAASTENASSDLPKFSSPDVQKFAEEYSAFVNESIEITKSGDVTKAQELATKAQEWVKKVQEVSAKMTPEDAKLWGDYYTKLSQKLTNPQ